MRANKVFFSFPKFSLLWISHIVRGLTSIIIKIDHQVEVKITLLSKYNWKKNNTYTNEYWCYLILYPFIKMDYSIRIYCVEWDRISLESIDFELFQHQSRNLDFKLPHIRSIQVSSIFCPIPVGHFPQTLFLVQY